MEHCQHLVQSTALAYGEWTIARDALERVNEYNGGNIQMKQQMEDMLLLFILDNIKQSTNWYLLMKSIDRSGTILKFSYKNWKKCA